MYVDHIVIWVKDAKRSLDFYVNTLGLESIREKAFLEGAARFPSIRLNENTIFDIMESNQLLPLVQKFTGGGEGIGGAPINHICLSTNHENYNAIIKRLEDQQVKLTPGGEDVFGAQGQAIRSTYFNDPDGNVLEIRFYVS